MHSIEEQLTSEQTVFDTISSFATIAHWLSPKFYISVTKDSVAMVGFGKFSIVYYSYENTFLMMRNEDLPIPIVELDKDTILSHSYAANPIDIGDSTINLFTDYIRGNMPTTRNIVACRTDMHAVRNFDDIFSPFGEAFEDLKPVLDLCDENEYNLIFRHVECPQITTLYVGKSSGGIMVTRLDLHAEYNKHADWPFTNPVGDVRLLTEDVPLKYTGIKRLPEVYYQKYDNKKKVLEEMELTELAETYLSLN